uniref:Bestrophin homolog n=1 Tax=Ascaris suum TaxID=6253 RepID=F1L206_ASCSU
MRMLELIESNTMTISYTLDITQTGIKSFIKLMVRWRGSVWKSVLGELIIWTVLYFTISLIYRFLLGDLQKRAFAAFSGYLDNKIDTNIPLAFLLGFFVTLVVLRWGSIVNELGSIENSAICVATFVRGTDEDTCILRRNIVRYIVLTQALVLRDISLQVRKRFPTASTLVAAGLLTKEENEILEDIHDPCNRYWCPIQWCYSLLYNARLHGKIASDFLLDRITNEISSFRRGLESLLKYDWIPVPLVYPQLVFLAVRLYFILCLISRQFLISETVDSTNPMDLYVPLTTMIQFLVYMGWMKVAEGLLNPFGEDDDDLECNYVIDKNLITGLSIADGATRRMPARMKDEFWGSLHIAPLYSSHAAKRTVHPMLGSANGVNLVKNKAEILMTPHKSKLTTLAAEEQGVNVKKVNVLEHNVKTELQKAKTHKKGAEKLFNNVRSRSTGKVVRERIDFGSGSERRTNGGATDVVTPLYDTHWSRTEYGVIAMNIGSNPLDIPAKSPPRDYSPYLGQDFDTNSGIDERTRAGLRRY